MSALGDALSHPALTVDGRDLTVADVAAVALYLGEWSAVCARAGAGSAVLETAPAPEQEVAAAAEAFRRERRLLAAEEMEAWLARRSLSAGEWMRWVRTDAARRLSGATVDDAPAAGASALYAEAICSGALGRAARWLAETLVAPAPSGAPDARTARRPDPASLERLGIDPGATAAMLDEVRLRAGAVGRLADQVADPATIAARVHAQQADWLAIDFRILVVAEASAAREAVLCVRDDGMRLEEVAALAGVDAAHEHALLCDLPPALAPHLLSASRGELIGPVEHGDQAAVVVLDAKVPPTPEDPEIARRARRELLTRALEREMATRVRWHDRL